MYSGETRTVDWYIVFTKANYSHWIFKFLDPWFQHVYAIKESPGGAYWVVVDPMNSHIDVDHHLCIDYLTPRDLAGEIAVIVPVRAYITKENKRTRGGFMSCVTVVKGLLGVDRPWLITPHQLYRHLYHEQSIEKGL